MKALSIRQPWAELIMIGLKTTEMRSWKTRYRGVLWIHTGTHQNAALDRHYGLSDLFRGGFVGTVDLYDVTVVNTRMVAWLLRSPNRFDAGIPATGKPGLFDVPTDLGNSMKQ